MTDRTSDDLAALLRRIDGRGYKAYKALKGRWSFSNFELAVDHVQGDPYAAPSRVRARLPGSVTGLPSDCCRPGPRVLGAASHLARTFAERARTASADRGTGKSGLIDMERPGQQVLLQSAIQVGPDGDVEARFVVGLPARGRRVLGRQAAALLTEDVPSVLRDSLVRGGYDPSRVRRAADTNEDADVLRSTLAGNGLVAFVADGARLPRASGVDDRPLREGAVPFQSPASLRISVELPHAGTVSGMGVPVGVTLIVGGGYHGKSTLLRALEKGVYNHRAGDGRERVVSRRDAVKIRAEDGRSVSGVDISRFIGRLPLGTDTRSFSTLNASGSTSQAAAIVEAIESGADTLLVDEDTSATNFMIRDRRMQELVPRADEPITPFVDRVRTLYERSGVSSVLVIGGSGDYLDVAHTVIALKDYRPSDVTAAARRVARELATERLAEARPYEPDPPGRVPDPATITVSRGRRRVSVKVRSRSRIEVGPHDIDLGGVDQIVSRAQARALARGIVLAREVMGAGRTVREVLDRVTAALDAEGLDALDAREVGDLAAFRRHELAAALNRIRGLAVTEAS